MTSKTLHEPDSSDRAPRVSDQRDRGDDATIAKRPPADGQQDESAIEAFEHEGAGIAAKE